MKKNKKIFYTSLFAAFSTLFFIFLAFLTIEIFASENALVKGNKALLNKNYDKALEYYQEASVDDPESPALYFNKGISFYRKQNYKKATDAFKTAALKTRNKKVEARAKYNLGNCSFFRGQRQQDSDLQKALKAYQESVQHYDQALKADPELKKAAHNIEVVRLIIKDLLDKIKKQQEQNKKNQKQQNEILEKLKQLIKVQKELLDTNKSLSKKNKNQDKQVKQLEEKQSTNKEDTLKLSNKVAKLQEQKLKPKTQKPGNIQKQTQNKIINKVIQHLDDSALAQDIATKLLAKKSLEKAQPQQKKALEELLKALMAMSPPQQNQKQQKQQKKQKGQQKQQKQQQSKQKKQQKQQKQTRKEKEKQFEQEKAQTILKEERKNKKEREKNSQYSSPEQSYKDW